MGYKKITEQDSLYDNLEHYTVEELVKGIHKEDQKVALAVGKVLPEITSLIEKVEMQLVSGGRLFYIGAGTSGRLGILDFQDAVWGPITYDVMSLLRDCYIEWPYELVKKWVLAFQHRLLEENLLDTDNPEQFLLWFDWLALQRHLKCMGIFSRLYYRDNKAVYLGDIPRVLRYAKSVCERHAVFEPLLRRYLQ